LVFMLAGRWRRWLPEPFGFASALLLTLLAIRDWDSSWWQPTLVALAWLAAIDTTRRNVRRRRQDNPEKGHLTDR